jgi:hypothetical protein
MISVAGADEITDSGMISHPKQEIRMVVLKVQTVAHFLILDIKTQTIGLGGR